MDAAIGSTVPVEDPSDDFVRLRDYVDVQNCLKLDAFAKEKLQLGFGPSMVEQAKQLLKINKVMSLIIVHVLFTFLFFLLVLFGTRVPSRVG